MSRGLFEFRRRYSVFAPEFTYGVWIAGAWTGEVARVADGTRWHASNKTWTGGADFRRLFKSRSDAADALFHVWNGTATVEDYAS